jgi:hypothetical protein
MPAASAEKRARQRTNKLLKTKSIAELAVLIVQTPEIIPPPSQSSQPTLAPPISSSPSPHAINFETFIDLVDLDDILRFCDAVMSTYEGRNLKLLWDCTFEAGLDQGRAVLVEERDLRDEAYIQEKAQGFKDAEEAANHAEIDLYSLALEKGRTEE